jgi:hypothetical protein
MLVNVFEPPTLWSVVVSTKVTPAVLVPRIV